MRISELGEFGLIDLVARHIAEREAGGRTGKQILPNRPSGQLLLGIGDDTAVWRAGTPIQLATTDTLVENVHFQMRSATWFDLGWKSLAVNLSDIASMGAYPTYALVTLGLPASVEVEDIMQFYDGALSLASEFDTRIVGGDMVKSQAVFVTVALFGEAAEQESESQGKGGSPLMRRDQAKPGDQLGVTNELGNSGGGLRILLSDRVLEPAVAEFLRNAHWRPQPRVREGLALSHAGVGAAMDISDGLLADLSKFCRSSRVAARVDVHRVPVNPLLERAFGIEALDLALGGGEDYELLFAASPALMDQLKHELPFRITAIGEVLQGTPGEVLTFDAAGNSFQPGSLGWDHYL